MRLNRLNFWLLHLVKKVVLSMMRYLLRMKYVTIQDKGNTEYILFFSQVGGCKRH